MNRLTIFLILVCFFLLRQSSGYTYTPPNPAAFDVPAGYVRVEGLEMTGAFGGIATSKGGSNQCAYVCSNVVTDCIAYVSGLAVNGVNTCTLLKSFTGARNTGRGTRNAAGQWTGTPPADYKTTYFKVLPGAWTGCPR